MFHLQVFARNPQLLQAVDSNNCATILNFGDNSINEWNLCQMEHVLHPIDLSMEVSAPSYNFL